MKRVLIFLVSLILLLSACAPQAAQLPAPDELFQQLCQAAELPPMMDVAADFLLDDTGIDPADCDGAVYYLQEMGTSPDEIIIVRLKDDAAAADALQRLQDRLTAKEEAAHVYLTEYLPVIEKGFVRRDGLTVSLVVSEHSDALAAVFDSFQ